MAQSSQSRDASRGADEVLEPQSTVERPLPLSGRALSSVAFAGEAGNRANR